MASFRYHMYGAVAATVAFLAGAFHGGASTRVIMMLEEVSSKGPSTTVGGPRLREGKRLMGLGNALYDVDDPRCKALKPLAEAMCRRTSS